MSTKIAIKLLILLNLGLLALGIYLFQGPDKSNILRFTSMFIVGVNAIFLLVNLRLHRKALS